MPAPASADSSCRTCSVRSGSRSAGPPGIPRCCFSSVLVVAGWGYFLYIGVIDPNGGINILWPLFGIANQMLAAIALAVVTAIFVRSGRLRHAWVPGLPLAWLVIVTSTAALQKIFSDDVEDRVLRGGAGSVRQARGRRAAPERAAVAPQLIFNQQLDGWLTVFFLLIVWVVVFDMVLRCRQHLSGRDAAADRVALRGDSAHMKAESHCLPRLVGLSRDPGRRRLRTLCPARATAPSGCRTADAGGIPARRTRPSLVAGQSLLLSRPGCRCRPYPTSTNTVSQRTARAPCAMIRSPALEQP